MILKGRAGSIKIWRIGHARRANLPLTHEVLKRITTAMTTGFIQKGQTLPRIRRPLG